MARMHSRKKGKSKSHKPLEKPKPTWIRYTIKEIELLIGKLAKEGKTSSEIGLILRDSYGIPDVKLLTKKKITVMLKEKNLASEIPEDLKALIKRAILVRKHYEHNKHDNSSKRGIQLTESKIKRLVKYYKESGKLKEEWKYDPATVRIYAE